MRILRLRTALLVGIALSAVSLVSGQSAGENGNRNGLGNGQGAGNSNRPDHAGSETGQMNGRRRGRVKRFEISNLDHEGRQNCGTQIVFQLFDDMPVQRFKDPNCPNMFQRPRRQGSFLGQDGGKTLNMARYKDSVIAASINDFANKRLYQVSGVQGESLSVTEWTLEDLWDEADVPEFPIARWRQMKELDSQQDTLTSTPAQQGKHPDTEKTREGFSNRQLIYNDSGSNIDVMVVWTIRAECAKSNGNNRDCTAVSSASHDLMMAHVQLAIDETNQAFVDSGINTELRLVHAYRHPTYLADNEDRSYNALLDITFDNMGGVHETRQDHGADLVALIINANDFCGIAWNLKDGVNIDWMFSVSHWSCATTNYSFGHEIGHNFGCNHDRGTMNACDTSQHGGYNYGYRDPNGNFRSILGYNCDQSDCDTNGNGCMRAQRFSNTFQNYGTEPIGSADSNCAQQFNDNIAEVAGFFPVADTSSPTSIPSLRPSSRPTLAPSTQPTSTPSAGPSSDPSSKPSPSPSVSHSMAPSAEPSFAPSETHSDTPTVLPSIVPTPVSPSSEPSPRPSQSPSSMPSSSPLHPSSTPSAMPSLSPTEESETPTMAPSPLPSSSPTLSSLPSGLPTDRPSGSPSLEPTLSPSQPPSMSPSSSPQHPSSVPSSSPSISPTDSPSAAPGLAPSQLPTLSPSKAPTVKPSRSPTESPSARPSSPPSRFPTSSPTASPSDRPTNEPSTFPTASPSAADWTGNAANACGFIVDENDNLVPGSYSVCLYRPEKKKYQTECLATAEIVGKNIGEYVTNDEYIDSCGCC